MTPQWTWAPKAAEFSFPNILAKCDFLLLLTFVILMGIKYCDGYILHNLTVGILGALFKGFHKSISDIS